MGELEGAESIEIVPLDDQILERRGAARMLGNQIERDEIGIQRPVTLDFICLPDEAEARGIPPIARFKKADQVWLAQVVVFARHRKVEI